MEKSRRAYFKVEEQEIIKPKYEELKPTLKKRKEKKEEEKKATLLRLPKLWKIGDCVSVYFVSLLL